MNQGQYEASELIKAPASDRAAMLAASWIAERIELNAAFRVDYRLRALQLLTASAVDAIAELDNYVEQRAAGRSPAVVAGMRALQDTTAHCSNLLIVHYMARPVDL